jgi:hypothetical protein
MRHMRFDTKIAIVLRTDLAGWQRLNVTAFLASAIAHATDDIMGQPYGDGSGNAYLPMFREPVLVFAADAEQLATVHERALRRGLSTAVYTNELFTTGNDDDNRAAVASVPAEKLDLVGLGLYGPRNAVDRTVKGLALHE